MVLLGPRGVAEYFVYRQRMYVNKSRSQTLVTLRKGNSDKKKWAAPGVMAAASPEIFHVGKVLVVCKGSRRTWAWVKATCRKGASHARTMTSRNGLHEREI